MLHMMVQFLGQNVEGARQSVRKSGNRSKQWATHSSTGVISAPMWTHAVCAAADSRSRFIMFTVWVINWAM